MLVVDAGTLFEVVTKSEHADLIEERLTADKELAAPHVIDVEVLGVIRRHFFFGYLERPAADQAIAELHAWPGERHGHGALLERAWELRANVRGWDAMYVALAESLGATLLTTDGRLARASGIRCRIDVVPRSG